MVSASQGISTSVPVQDLRSGDHACLVYATDEFLWQALTVHTWAGLADGQRATGNGC